MANRKVSPLTDTEIKTAKTRDKEYSIPDGNGLQLIIKPDGRKVWEIRYTIDGKPKKTTAGTYPTVTLSDARKKRDEYKTKVSKGIDPIQEKREIKEIIKLDEVKSEAYIAGQFHRVAYDWFETLTENADSTREKRKASFESDIFPYLCTYDENHVITSSKHISEITHPELLKILLTKEAYAPVVAVKRFNDCNRLWRYAINHGHTEINTADKITPDAFKKHEAKHFPKITNEKILGEMLRAIDDYKGEGGVIVKNVLRFVALLPLRADNLCKLKWESIDFDTAVITIPRSEMKIKDKNLPDFTIPLPHQAVLILKEIKEITGWGVWVFHGVRNNKTHVNLESGNKALRAMGFNDEVSGRKQTLHSFRGTYGSLARTYQPVHNATFEAMERVLDHQEGSKVVRAYTHKADYTEQMRELLQWWADYLDEVKNNAKSN
ncbi:integrase arm-type DNA-binding domain-containing protein [bacterium]|nr:integrase arm-type DNA-binding domain-containing protein [bacterium]